METSNINITVDVNETIQTQHHQTNEPIGATPVPVAHEAAKAQANVDCDAKHTADTERPVDVLIKVVDDAAPIHSNNSTSNIESETKNQQQQLKQKDMESNKGTNSADDIEVHESMVSAVSDGSDSSVTHSIDGNEGDDENSNHNMNENNCDDEQKSEFILHKLSNYRGLCWNKNRQSWLVRIHCHGDRLYIGNFKDEIEAAMAFDKKARELFGKDAALNFPGEGERSAPKHKLPSRYIENKQEGKAEISCESNGNGASAICESNGYNFKQREPRAASYRLLRKTSGMNQGYSPLKHKRDLPESFQTEPTTTSKPIGIFENESPRKRKRENSRSSEDICLSDDTMDSRSRRDSLVYTNGVSLSNTKISTTKTATSKFDSVTPTITKQSLGSLNTMHQTPLKFNPLLLAEAGKTIAVNEAKSNANALLNSFLNQSLTKGQLFQNGNASKLPSLPAFGNHLQLMGYQPSNNTNNISGTSNSNNINIGSNQAFQHQLLAQMNQSFAPTQYFPTQTFNGMNMGSQASMHPEQYIKSFVHPGFVQARMNSIPSVKPQERGVSMENFTNFNSFNPSSIDVKYPRLFF